jgi:AcrR family transcriptional regulator
LPPAERRAALVSATLELIREHGTEVSTRQIAAAAGVAEGTIFRVFPDKDSLVRASIDAALDPASTTTELERIDLDAALDEKLLAVTRISQRWVTSVISLMMALHRGNSDGQTPPPRSATSSDVITPIVVRLVEPHRKQLRVEPSELAKLLRLMVFSSSHPIISAGNPLTAEQIVDLLLDGVRLRDSTPINTAETKNGA